MPTGGARSIAFAILARLRAILTHPSAPRWTHTTEVGKYDNCYDNQKGWDPTLCPNASACYANCAIEGVSAADYADNYGVDGVGWSEDREEFEEEQSGMQWHPAAHVAGRMHCRHAYGGARANRCCRYWSRREIVEDPGVTYWKREPESL